MGHIVFFSKFQAINKKQFPVQIIDNSAHHVSPSDIWYGTCSALLVLGRKESKGVQIIVLF